MKYVIPHRSSSRHRSVTKKLVINWDKTKYDEKEVRLTEDIVSQIAPKDMITDEEEEDHVKQDDGLNNILGTLFLTAAEDF